MVAIVDDEQGIHRLLARLLNRRGFRSMHALGTRDLIGIAEAHTPDAFVLDLHLAEVQSGLEVLAWLRLQPQYATTPVVILTGLTRLPDDELEFIRKHGASIFFKSDPLDAVIDAIEALLTGSGDHDRTRLV
jgi:ActR/RegA family two-component response regulator